MARPPRRAVPQGHDHDHTGGYTGHGPARYAGPRRKVFTVGVCGPVFSRELADVFIFVLDVAEGDKMPRKGGPGICTSGLLVINKTDLSPYVGADLDVMRSDSQRMRGDRPFLMISLNDGSGANAVVS